MVGASGPQPTINPGGCCVQLPHTITPHPFNKRAARQVAPCNCKWPTRLMGRTNSVYFGPIGVGGWRGGSAKWNGNWRLKIPFFWVLILNLTPLGPKKKKKKNGYHCCLNLYTNFNSQSPNFPPSPKRKENTQKTCHNLRSPAKFCCPCRILQSEAISNQATSHFLNTLKYNTKY